MSTQPAGESAEIAPNVLAVMRAAKVSIATPSGGWLRAARTARGASQKSLAQKLGVKRQAWAQLEASEAREAISLYSLRRAADAMGYDVVCFLVPREAPMAPVDLGSGYVIPGISPTLSLVVPSGERQRANDAWQEIDLPTELR